MDMWPLWPLLVEKGFRPRAYVAKPRSRGAVERIVEAAAEAGACLVPRGGGSNVVGASPPLGCCLILDLRMLDKILWFSGEDLVVHVEAGAVVSKVEEWLNRRGYTLGYHPQSQSLATVGGSIAMLGSGALAPGLGNIEDMVLWLETVIPGLGTVTLGSRNSPRGWEGPGVKHLFIGSEGSLGVVVSAGLRVRPLPEFTGALAYRLPGFREGLEAARRLTLWRGARLLRLLDPSEASMLYGVDGAVLMVEVEAPDRGLLEAMEGYVEKVASASGGSRVEGVYEKWARARYMYDEHVRQLWSAGLWVDTIDTAAPWSRVEDLNRRLLEDLAGIPGVVAVMSHAGHFYSGGASLYHTVVMERRLDTYWRVWSRVAEAVRQLGASITHQHGWGLLRKPYLGFLGGNYRVFCRVKNTLDPGNVLNPNGISSRCSRVG